MKTRSWLRSAVVLIGAVTMVSGAAQAVAPGFILEQLSADTTPASLHFFGIVGMFMVLFGGLLLHAVWSPSPQGVAIFWAGLQKFGASVAVGLGVLNGVFASMALLVAAFDLLSGVLILMYWRTLRSSG